MPPGTLAGLPLTKTSRCEWMCLPACPGTPYSKRSDGTPAFRARASAAAGRGHGTAPLDGAAAAGAVAVVVVVAAAEPDEPPPHAASRHRHVAALASKAMRRRRVTSERRGRCLHSGAVSTRTTMAELPRTEAAYRDKVRE